MFTKLKESLKKKWTKEEKVIVIFSICLAIFAVVRRCVSKH